MKSILKNYGSTIALLAGLVVGGCLGVFAPSAAHALKPVGDIFLNFLFVLVVPMVFFSIAVSICSLKKSGMMGRVMGIILAVFLCMSVLAGLVCFVSMLVCDPLGNVDKDLILSSLPEVVSQSGSLADAIVGSVSVTDFMLLFSKSNLLPLIIFAGLLGVAVASLGEKGGPVESLLQSGNEVVAKMMSMVMWVAPMGLGCFFADTLATLGGQLLTGFLRSFILYLVLTALFFLVINPLYVLLFRGREGFKAFWRHILPPSLTALASCSSSAAMPANIEASKKMGVEPVIAESVIPFGTNVHKDGSVVSGMIKTAFLMLLFGQSITTLPGAATVLVIGILSSIVLGAITGGAMVGELLICTLLGFPPEMAGVIIVLGTLFDMPATLLNSSSNVVAALLVDSVFKKTKH